MPLFNRSPYVGGYGTGRGQGFRIFLLILGIVFGLYFLNFSFAWVKIPALGASALKVFNTVTGVLLIILGLATIMRPRYY